jgi:cytochrome b
MLKSSGSPLLRHLLFLDILVALLRRHWAETMMIDCREYLVWDRTVRAFHWLNFICVVALVFSGWALQHTTELALALPGNLRLKTLHALVGYVFALNLIWRLVWGFTGGHFARWRQMLPMGRGYGAELVNYVRRLGRPDAPTYLGHNPLGRISISVMLLTLLLLGASGLVLTGTDLYMPPFGRTIAAHIAAPGVAPWQVKPHLPDAASDQDRASMMATVNPRAYAAMIRLRRPVAHLHDWGYYVLLLLVVVHIAAVVKGEIGADSGIVSAMFSGKKLLSRRPADLPGTDQQPLQRRGPQLRRVTMKASESE